MEKIKLIGYKEKPFYFYSYEIENANKMMIVVHGVAEDAIRYDYFAKKLNEVGFNVYVINHIAHGQDTKIEDLGHWEKGDFDGCIININHLYNYVLEKNKNNLKILFGHSMGSFVVQKYQLMFNKFDKLILCGCAKPNFKYKLGKYIINLIGIFKKKNKRVPGFEKASFGAFNKKFKPNETNVDWLSKNKENRQYYMDSPYCGFVCTVSFYKEFYRNVSKIPNSKYKNLYEKDYPILLIGGSDDMVSSMSKLLIKLANYYKKQSDKVEYKIYEGDRHEILNEDNKDEIIKDIIDFVNK